jgi:DEAD/DEAH box helicase
MFPVGRYDPQNKEHHSLPNGVDNRKGNKKRRRKRDNNRGNDANKDGRPKSTLRVIAPDETAHMNLPSRILETAADAVNNDFALFPMVLDDPADLVDDVIEVDEAMRAGTAATSSTTPAGQEASDNMDDDGAGDDHVDVDHAAADDDDDLTMMTQMQEKKAAAAPAVHQHHGSVVSVGQASPAEIQAALQIARLPLEQAAQDVWQLAPFLVDNLKRDGFTHFFPIQALSIPDVIASERHYHVQAQDVCITAPTGSGKTLAFVLPVLNALADRQVCRLRALIVLPSRDLAIQVFRVFESYVQGSKLKVGLAIGQSDFTAEQVALTVGNDDDDQGKQQHQNNSFDDMSNTLQRLRFDPGNLELTLRAYRDAANSPHVAVHPLDPLPRALVVLLQLIEIRLC